jgi:hypothetical protein
VCRSPSGLASGSDRAGHALNHVQHRDLGRVVYGEKRLKQVVTLPYTIQMDGIGMENVETYACCPDQDR